MSSRRVTRKTLFWISLALIVSMSVVSVGKADSTTVKVEPEVVTVGEEGEPYPIGEEFTVNITVYDVIGLYGWEFQLYWDNTILNCTDDVVHVPPEWEGDEFALGAGINQTYDTTHGRYHRGLACVSLPPFPVLNGTVPLVTLTFNVTAGGSSTLDLVDTKLADTEASPILHDALDGTANVIPEFPASLILLLTLTITLIAIILGKTAWSKKGREPTVYK